MATIDLGNVIGPQGPKGSVWYKGTEITGTASEGVVFSASGITEALVDDMYLNTSTGDVYTCVLGGMADVAEWAYVGSLKGPRGEIGPEGPTGTVDENTPIAFEEAAARENIASNESISILFGKIKKWFSDLGTAAFYGVSNVLTQTQSGKYVLDAAQGKVLQDNKLEKTAVVNNLTTTASGYVLDARQGKELQSEIDSLNSNINRFDNLNFKFVRLENDGGIYLKMETTAWNKCYALVIGSDNVSSIVHEAVFAFYDSNASKIVVYSDGEKTWTTDQTGKSVGIKASANSKFMIFYYGFTKVDAYYTS